MVFILIFLQIVAPLAIGYASGYMKYYDTENHNVKAVAAGSLFAILAVCIYYMPDWFNVLGFLLIWKPFHDFGYTKGDKSISSKYFIYIGETSWDDIIIRKLGIWWVQQNTKFPLLYFIYFLLLTFGLGFNISF